MEKVLLFSLLFLTTLLSYGQLTQYIDGFENIQSGNLRNYPCWEGSSSNIQVRKGANIAYSGTQYAIGKDGEYIVSQKYLFETGKTYYISFYYNIFVASNNSITVTTTDGVTGTFSNPTPVSITSTGWVLYTTSFIPTSSTRQGSFQVSFTSTYADYNILIDNMVITVPKTSFIDTRAICAGTELPVHFVSFTGSVSGSNIILDWVVIDEIDNDYFVVECSVDGMSFSSVGIVDGTGTIDFSKYTFTHYNVIEPSLYYRLKQVDFNGDYTYTHLIHVTNGYLQENARIYDFQGNMIYEGVLLDFFTGKAEVGKSYIINTPSKSFKVTII
jgi:hypothetical protein